VPRDMHAMIMTEPGEPEVLRPASVPLAWPAGPDQVLVRLKAAGLNPADAYFRRFGPYCGDGKNCILGHDGAGVVEEVGAGVKAFKAGDPVCFYHGGIGATPGTYAGYAVVPEALLVPKPDSVGFTEAAALPLVFITLWESLNERAGVKKGEFVLIHGGAGGTGHIGVQVARLLGGRVAATVSSGTKADFVTALGAERPILYREEDFVAAARAWTGGNGLDVALDNVGGEIMQRTYAAMAAYGRIVTLMGTPADTQGDDAYNGNLTIHNVMMLTPMWRGLQARLREQAGMVRQGIAWLAEGRLKVHVGKTFPLGEAAAAHRFLESGGVTGKLVLTMEA